MGRDIIDRSEAVLVLTWTSKHLVSVCLPLTAAGKGFLPPHRDVVSSASVLAEIFRVPSKSSQQSPFLIPVAKWSKLSSTNFEMLWVVGVHGLSGLASKSEPAELTACHEETW